MVTYTILLFISRIEEIIKKLMFCAAKYHKHVLTKRIRCLCIYIISLIIFFTILLSTNFLHAHEESKNKPILTLSNFFSEGWKFGSWEEPAEEPDRSPRFKLLKISAPVFEREVRMNYSFTNNGDGGKIDEHELELELEVPVSRRLLIEVEPKVLSVSPNDDEEDDHIGFGDTSLLSKVMLLETCNTTLLSVFGAEFPTGNENHELGSGMTTIITGLGLWRDLGRRFAIHNYFGLDIPAGGKSEEAPDTTIKYAAALAKTFTSKDTYLFGNLTLFVELNGGSDIGSHSDNTLVSILPGIRWNLRHGFWLMPGIEFPITNRDEFDNRVWFSVLKDF